MPKKFEKEGFLQGSKRRTQILAAAKLDAVLMALWQLPMAPIDRITFFFVLTLLEATGLRPEKLSRYPKEEDDCFAELRSSPFVWEDVNLIY